MMNSKPKPTRSFNQFWSGVNLSDFDLTGKAGRWVMLKFVHLAAQGDGRFNCLCVTQDIGHFLAVIRYYCATWLLKYLYWWSFLSCLLRMSSSLPGGSQTPTLPNYVWYPLLLLLERKQYGKLTWVKVVVTSCFTPSLKYRILVLKGPQGKSTRCPHEWINNDGPSSASGEHTLCRGFPQGSLNHNTWVATWSTYSKN